MGTQSRAIQTSALTPIVRRRSPRLMAIEATNNDKLLVNDEASNKDNKRKLKSLEKATASKKFSKKSTAKKMTKTSTTIKKKSRTLLKDTDNKNSVKLTYLPRTREQELKQHNPKVLVIGVDEAGRGPLAGPVVVAAAIITENIDGITDSKKITKEEMREELYEKIKSSPNASWAIAIVEAQRIDEINILQATMEAMTMATSTLVSSKNFIANGGRIMKEASSKIDGSYVVCSNGSDTDVDLDNEPHTQNESSFYALIDGNRVPKELPCQSEAMVKGDSREYAIGAASILAKVTRDRLMREYDLLYPEYELSRHKGML
jgi:ribonuclease HII